MEILDCENLSNYCIDGAYVCILEAIHKKIARMDDKEFRFVCEPAPVISNEAFENDVVFEVVDAFPENVAENVPINIESRQTEKRPFFQISPSSVIIALRAYKISRFLKGFSLYFIKTFFEKLAIISKNYVLISLLEKFEIPIL